MFSPACRGEQRARASFGVSIVEILVVIGVIGVLIGITVPALRGARGSAGEVKSLANLKGIGISIALYADSHADEYPFIEAGRPVTVAPPVMGKRLLQCGYSPHWLLEGMWPVLMHEVAPWPDHFESWLSPGLHRDRLWPMGCGQAADSSGDGGWVSYRYVNSLIAAPKVWNGKGDATKDDIRPVRTSNVDHPSHKVVMYDYDRAYLPGDPTPRTRRPLLFADGSSSLRLDSDAAAPVRNPLYWNSPRIYHDTPWGARGRDF